MRYAVSLFVLTACASAPPSAATTGSSGGTSTGGSVSTGSSGTTSTGSSGSTSTGSSGTTSTGSTGTRHNPGTALLVLTPTAGANFGSVVVGESAETTINVANTGTSTASQIADASGDLGDFSYTGGVFPGTAGTCTATLSAADGCTLDVTFVPSAYGTRSATLRLAYVDDGGAQAAAIALSGSGVQAADSGGVDKTVDSLGTQAIDDSEQSSVLTAHKNDTDAAITIIAIATDPSFLFAVDDIEEPGDDKDISEQSYIEANGDWNYAKEKNISYPETGAQAVMIPQTPSYSAPSGDYQFVISTDAPNVAVDVFVVHTPAGVLNHVNVNFFLGAPGGSGAALTAATVQAGTSSDAKTLLRMIQAFVKQWGGTSADLGTAAAFVSAGDYSCDNMDSGSLGLCIDSINFFDLPSAYDDISGDTAENNPPDKDLVELFLLTQGKPAGVNFFLVDSVSLPGVPKGYILLGVDGAIPAPGAFNGTARSGCVIGVDSTDISGGAAGEQAVGATIAHEGGHYLGLFHPQESDCSFDDISDTTCDPNCTCLESDDCNTDYTTACSDPHGTTETYTMFWSAEAGQKLFTPDQIQIVQTHPLVYGGGP